MAEVPISGSIDPKGFPFLLTELHRQGATGSLKVEGPSYQKALYFRGGRVLFGSSNDPRDQLGSILIEAGKITPEQLEDVNAKVGPGHPLAKVLADTGFVSQRELSDAARAKVERILSDVIAYTSGAFEFEDGVLPKGAVDLKLSTERLTLAAVRRIADRAFVLRHLEGLDVVLTPAAAAAERLPEVESETSGLAAQLDGERTLKDAAARARLDEFEAAKIACGLLFLGLVQRGPAPATKPAGRAAEGELDLGATAAEAFTTEPAASPAPAPAPAPAVAPPTPAAEEEPAFVFTAVEPAAATLGAHGAVPPEPPFAVHDGPAFETGGAPPQFEAEPPVPPPSFETEAPTLITPPAPKPAPGAPVAVATAPEPALPRPHVAEPRAPDTSIPKIVPPPPRPRPSRPSPSDVPHIEVPAPARPARPSKDDLAALDELLNPKGLEGPLAPLEKPAGKPDRWAPQFRGARGPTPGRRSGTDARRPVAIGAAAVIVLGLGAAGWYFTRQRPAVPAARPPSPSTAVATTLATAPAAPISTAPAATKGGPATSPVGAAPPTAPGARPAATPPTARPAAPAPADAHELLRSGRFPEAARGFTSTVEAAGRGAASIQLLVACSTDTIQKAVDAVPGNELLIVPVNYKGRDCYRMLWGLYPSPDRATTALRSLPEYFRQGGASPRVIAASEIVP